MPKFATPDPIEVTLDIIGDARITASDRTDTVVSIRPRDTSRAADVRAAEQAQVEYADGRLLVRSPKNWRRYTPFGGGESVDLTIEVPTGSSLVGETGMGDFHAEGELGQCRLTTAMGNIRLDHTGSLEARTAFGKITVDHVSGDADVSTGSGDLRIEGIDGSAVLKNSNGDTVVGAVVGAVRAKSANGDISIASADASVVAKTACGDVRIADVGSGTIVMETSAGELEVGIRAGVAAWLDVRSKFGSIRNDLGPADGPGSSDGTVEVRARTSVGDILIHRADRRGSAS